MNRIKNIFFFKPKPCMLASTFNKGKSKQAVPDLGLSDEGN